MSEGHEEEVINKRSALRVGVIVTVILATLTGGTAVVTKTDELIDALAKGRVEAAYQRGVDAQKASTLQQTALLSACHNGLMCMRQSLALSDLKTLAADCDKQRQEAEAAALRTLEGIE